ncbi:helix-turn-helix domain-containing protein [Sphingomonas qilianensis]|uniref:Helix-turn-helix domain-containing protein n=1 Tax=Sphingomonas qilianensis TaxID=1736690 RepID=A0ABU9XTV3_9SPHN
MTPPAPASADGLVGCTLAQVERALILETLDHCRGNRTSAALMLGISVRTMRNKLRSFIEDGVAVLPAP